MKKVLSIVLSLAMLLSMTTFISFAKVAYPESKHNYEDNSIDSQIYVHTSEVEGLYVTFSSYTKVEPSDTYSLIEEEYLTDEKLQSLIEKGYYKKKGDTISIYYKDNLLYGVWQGSDLAGNTLYIPGNSFKVVLESDESTNYYGYKITNISETLPKGKSIAVYHIGDSVYSYIYNKDTSLYLNSSFRNMQNGHKIIVGWSYGENKYYYRPYETKPQPITEADGNGGNVIGNTISNYDWYYGTDITYEEGKIYDLYPITTDIYVNSDEVYSFNNSTKYFCNQLDGYYYIDTQFYQNYIDWGLTFGLSLLAPAAMAVCFVNTVVWPTTEWNGSCCGFPITVVLQKEGQIDLLKKQGVSKMSELEPNEELVSIINFYNSQAVGCFPLSNKGIEKGTKAYSSQLKALYNSLREGNPCYFEYYGNSGHIIKKIVKLDLSGIDYAHGVLLTGAYTNAEGDHIIIGYNNQTFNYARSTADIYVIDKDFTKIMYNGEEIVGFSWNDDFSAYKSFPAEGVPSPTAWHVSFMKHIFQVIKEFFRNLFD